VIIGKNIYQFNQRTIFKTEAEMMKTINVTFQISTRYVGSEMKEEIELLVPEDATEDQLDEILREAFEEWVWESTDGGWKIN